MADSKDRANIVIFFTKDADQDQIEEFPALVLGVNESEDGLQLADRVGAILSVFNSGYQGYAIHFTKNASPDQRNSLLEQVKKSPIVYKVYENAIPDEIVDP